jgi:hypothetical protein
MTHLIFMHLMLTHTFLQPTALPTADPNSALRNIAHLMSTYVLGALAIAFAYGGYLWFTSAENPSRRSLAYTYLIGSAIGAVIVYFAPSLAQQIVTAIGG